MRAFLQLAVVFLYYVLLLLHSHRFPGKNLMAVAVHEFGHSLGLDHSDVKTAVMYQYFNSEKPNMKLDIDDIRGIQSIYGESNVHICNILINKLPI